MLTILYFIGQFHDEKNEFHIIVVSRKLYKHLEFISN